MKIAHPFFALVLPFLFLTSCGEPKVNEFPESDGAYSSDGSGGDEGCGQYTPPEGKTVAKVVYKCQTTDRVKVTNDDLGGASINKGAFILNIKGLGGTNIGSMALFFLMHGLTSGSENQNVKIGIWGSGPSYNMRLNRFYKSSSGQKDEKNNNLKSSFTPEQTYTFSCEWDEKAFGCAMRGTDGVTLDWFDIGLKGGGFDKLSVQQFTAGAHIYGGKTAGVNVKVTGLTFVVFE